MSYFVQKSDFIDNTIMWADVIKELTVNGGFKLISVDDSALVPSIDTTVGIKSAVIEATPLCDTISNDQPWRIRVEVTAQQTRLYAATPTQIQDTGRPSIVGTDMVFTQSVNRYSGCIGTYHSSANTDPKDMYEYMFYCKGDRQTGPVLFGVRNGTYSRDVDDSDFAAIPMSYAISTTDHGVMFASWIEGLDGTGNNQNWFVIQRAINADGSIVTTGKAPLFCMYSQNNSSINRFTVREADVNAPTASIDATTDTADSNRVINNKQQVCFSENGRFDFKFPQGFNTARYSYAYQIDMIAYTSADVCSQRLDVNVQVYNEKNADNTPKLRTYRALGANGVNNTGMRVFMLVPASAT